MAWSHVSASHNPTSAQTLAGSDPLELATRRQRSLWGDAWRRLIRNRAAVAGMIVIAFFALLAVFAPQIAPQNPVVQLSSNNFRLPI